MSKSEKQKLKILYIAKYLHEFSDENHPVTVDNIIEYLSSDEIGITAERRSIQRDIKILRDDFGMDIDWQQGSKFYKLNSREFDFDDLRLLAECAHAAKFISNSKAKKLVSAISKFGSEYQAEELQSEVFLCDRVKTTQTNIMATIAQINTAMAARVDGQPHSPQKISFQYIKHSISDIRKTVERRGGERYIVSPYKLLINDGNYYLLAYSDKYQAIRTYRVDRMSKVELLPEGRDGEKAFREIEIESYTRNVFSMYSGEMQRVQIRFHNSLLDTVIERFGTGADTTYFPDKDYHFIVTANVEVSDQFFSWICGFRRKATIIQPKSVVEDMKEFLNDIHHRYKSE